MRVATEVAVLAISAPNVGSPLGDTCRGISARSGMALGINALAIHGVQVALKLRPA